MVRTQKLGRNLYSATISVKNGKMVGFTTPGSKLKVITGSSPQAIRREIKLKYS